MNTYSRTFDEAWQRFVQNNSLRLVEDTLEYEWRRGRMDYLAFLVPVEVEAARRHIRQTIERLEPVPGVQPYQESYWHITVKGVGFRVDSPSRRDEITPAVAESIAEEARSALSKEAAFEVIMGPVNALEGVVCVEVEAGGRIQQINRHLLEVAPDMPRSPVDDYFLPHISIAHFTSDDGIDELKSTLAQLREEHPRGPSFTVSRIDLILARLSESGPTFEPLASYRLQTR